jgi:prepilin signal peptidase PulO-like enzyme (type II secretory pathway)
LDAELEGQVSVGLGELVVAWKAAFGCLLLAAVLTMVVIDRREMRLPNRLNAILAAGGTGQAVLVGRPDLTDALLGSLFGFVVLSMIAALFRYFSGIDGLGFGDREFAAAAGLWIGWEQITSMLLIASCSALIFIIVRSAKSRERDIAMRLPFGPFLGLGTVACRSMTIVPGS